MEGGGGGEGKGGAQTKTDGETKPTVLFHGSLRRKVQTTITAVSDTDSIKLLPTRGETKKKKEEKKVELISTSGETEKI